MKRKYTKTDDSLVTCWMCGGWGFIHPLDTGEKSHNGQPLYVWAASRAQHQPGDVDCPVCEGDGKTQRPFNTNYPGDILPIESRIW